MVFRASKLKGSVAGVKHVPDHGDLGKILEALQSQGKVIVAVSGAFDLLHVGHLRMLRDAKSRGDYLLVAVQSDAAVRKHKHASLPIVPAKERIEMLEAIDCVDYVTSYNDVDVNALLGQLKPNIYAAGTDYKLTTIPERETVLAYGGRLLVVGDSKKHSSTELMKRVKAIRKLPESTPVPSKAKAAAASA